MGTTKHLRRLFIVVLLSNLSFCAHQPATLPGAGGSPRIYAIEPDDLLCANAEWCRGKAGLYHFESKTVIPFDEARNFIAIEPDEFGEILLTCPTN